jgi:hypothetical protein
MLQYLKFILFLAFAIFVFAMVGAGIDYVETLISGEEYCFNDATQQEIEFVFKGAGIKFTNVSDESICFRTHDFNKVEVLSQQVQDRKYQEALAQIESNERIAKRNFPLLVFGIIAIFAIIIVAVVIWNRNSSNGGIC